MKILLGVTGSVAAILTLKIQESLEQAGHEIRTVVTSSAMKIGDDCDWRAFYTDADEWESYNDNVVEHIELTKWADMFIIAPCSANTLAKLANGICDNLLTCCARAWDLDKQMLVAPAMNTRMWEHPVTKEHIAKLSHWGIGTVYPQAKTLFCGDTGLGAMADISEIISRIE